MSETRPVSYGHEMPESNMRQFRYCTLNSARPAVMRHLNSNCDQPDQFWWAIKLRIRQFLLVGLCRRSGSHTGHRSGNQQVATEQERFSHNWMGHANGQTVALDLCDRLQPLLFQSTWHTPQTLCVELSQTCLDRFRKRVEHVYYWGC